VESEDLQIWIGARIERILGSQPLRWVPVKGGYSTAPRWVVKLNDGRSCFAKVGATPGTRPAVRHEYQVYTVLQAPFVPRLVGWDDHSDYPLLLLEDLSHGTWPPPWTPERISRVLDTLRTMASTTPPESLPSQERYREVLSGWRVVAQDPEPFLRLGAASRGWLEPALPPLLEASSRAVLEGDSLVHYDVRSDNICFLEDRTVLVDWNGACRGNPMLDLVGWLPSLALEGGPAPESLIGDEATDLVALVSGYWAARAGLPPPKGAPFVRSIQLAQLKIALPWAARLLRLPPPDGDV
jgi:hypothetical protein